MTTDEKRKIVSVTQTPSRVHFDPLRTFLILNQP